VSDPASASAFVLDEAELTRAARRAGGALRALGCKPGDRVALLGGNGVEHVVLRDACTALDLTCVPLNPKLTAHEIAELVSWSGARMLLVDSHDRPVPEGVEVWSADDLARMGADQTPARAKAPQAIGATLLFTSGTTGRPKGCLRTAEQEAARAAELRATYAIGPQDVHLIVCPLAHSAPGIFLRACRAAGAKTVLLSKFDPRGFLGAVRAHAATIFFLVPTQVERLLALPADARAAADWSRVRAVIVAGAPFAEATKRRFVDWIGPGKLWEFYGSSETGTIAVCGPDDQPAPSGCVGRPPAGVELELRDGGEVFVRSPTVMHGYLGEPPVAPGAMVSVGDLARLDEHGRLVLVDRKHDTIITGGVNVYPAEVERALAEHPDVAGAVVCGVPDPDWGERVVALVSARDGHTVDAGALRDWLRARLAAFKMPKDLRVVPLADLPLGSSGKPLRRAARALFTR
jgi:acyl-CoA synthetase (AMP-forming)/AMP-acid ligase II